MSAQRRHGQTIKIWPVVTTTDRRGNKQQAVDMTATPITTRAQVSPGQSALISVPGEMTSEAITLRLDPGLADTVTTWARIEYMGSLWDVIASEYHDGPRAVRHVTATARKRPYADEVPGDGGGQ